MIRIKHKGNFRNTERFFAQAQKATPRQILERYGQAGVTALASATPVESEGVVRKAMLNTLLSSSFLISMILAPLFLWRRRYPSERISVSVSC